MHVLLKMDESTYDEDDGSDGTDDDHPISWCKKFDGGRSFYTGLGHTQASYAEAGIRSHIAAGIEIAAGMLASAACGVAPATPGTDVPVTVGGTVPTVLVADARPGADTRHVRAGRRPRLHGVADGDGHLDRVVRSADRPRPEHASPGPSGQRHARARVTAADEGRQRGVRAAQHQRHAAVADDVPRPGERDPVTIDLKQTIAATEGLQSGNYGKTLTFTLSATTP